MSFFAQHASVSTGGDFETAPEGQYLCRLKEVELTEGRDFNNPEILKPQFKWVFETVEETDSQNRPYRFSKWTGRSFGNDKAGLTILIDGMAGKRLTDQQFNDLNLDNLKRATWKVMWLVEPSTGKGKIASVRNAAAKQHVQDTPLRPQPRPKGEAVDVSDLEDPFTE